MRERELVVQLGSGQWALTPLGEQAVAEIAITWSAADYQTEFVADFAGTQHHTIGAELAPVLLAEPIGRFLEAHPFERNVFGISRYPRPAHPDDPMSATLATVKGTLAKFGLELHLASDRSVADQLWPNVAASMWACRYGVAIIEDRVDEGVNPNLLIEVGSMLITGRRCVMRKDSTITAMPTDLVGHIRKDIDLDDQATIAGALEQWCSADLGLIELS